MKNFNSKTEDSHYTHLPKGCDMEDNQNLKLKQQISFEMYIKGGVEH